MQHSATMDSNANVPKEFLWQHVLGFLGLIECGRCSLGKDEVEREAAEVE